MLSCPTPATAHPDTLVGSALPSVDPAAGGRRACPHCGGSHVQKFGFMRLKSGNRVQRYLCVPCNRTFNASTGTPTAGLRKLAAWNRMIGLLTEELSLRKVASRLGIRPTTAFKWRHRAAAALSNRPRSVLSGQVGISVALVQYSEKGSKICNGPGSRGYWNAVRRGPRPTYWQPSPFVTRHWPQPARPRFRLLVDGRPVWVMTAQAGGRCEAAILGQQRLTPAALVEGLQQLVGAGSQVVAHIGGAMATACEELGLDYRSAFDIQGQERDDTEPVADEDGQAEPEVRTQGVNPQGRDFRWWLKQFKGVATRYLHHYTALFRLVCEACGSTAYLRATGELLADG